MFRDEDGSRSGSASTATSAMLSLRSRAQVSRGKGHSHAAGSDTYVSMDSVEISAQSMTQTFPSRLKLGAEQAQGSASEAVIVSRGGLPKLSPGRAKASAASPNLSTHATSGTAYADGGMNSTSASGASYEIDRCSVRSGRPRKSRTHTLQATSAKHHSAE